MSCGYNQNQTYYPVENSVSAYNGYNNVVTNYDGTAQGYVAPYDNSPPPSLQGRVVGAPQDIKTNDMGASGIAVDPNVYNPNIGILPQPTPTPLPEPLPSPVPDSSMPETLAEYIYTPGFLRNHIGSMMRVEFLVGNNTSDRVGILQEVGASYIVLGSLEADSRIMCDIYSIKFVTIIGSQLSQSLLASF